MQTIGLQEESASHMSNGFYEFFAGGGMARAGLGSGWHCLFANDFDAKKAAAYTENWGGEHLRVGDVAALSCADLPRRADLAWASFPCQDLSLAGAGAGLEGARSSSFWPFWKLMIDLGRQARAPRLIVLENVYGALTSHGGKDFATISQALTEGGYHFGAMLMDAADFLPQSRPRLFIVAAHASLALPSHLLAPGPLPQWHPPALISACQKLSPVAQQAWRWWQLPAPPARQLELIDVIEREPSGVHWHTPQETQKLLSMMAPLHQQKVQAAQASGRLMAGAVYKRTRARRQCAEVRFDGTAGCLRTPAGGSSRQTLLLVEGESIRSRLLSPREAARLMGLPDSYALPANYNEAYHLAGDGVAVPVVRFLAAQLLEPLLAFAQTHEKKAA